jgi:RNA polymerase sigma factor (sigma-70 family)
MAEFPSTLWTTIRSAQTGDPAALSRIFRSYQPAVVRFVQSEGFKESDADDVAQEVFSVVCSEPFLAKVDASKGRFRSLILAVTKNMVLLEKRRRSTLKRGAGKSVVSVDEARDRGIEFDIPDTQSRDLRDEKFDTYWVQSLVTQAMKLLKEECDQKQSRFYDALEGFVAGRSYEEVGRSMGLSEDQIRSFIHQARRKLKRIVERLVMEYAVSSDEYQKELDYLWKLLRK